jgi:hypothetical protein
MEVDNEAYPAENVTDFDTYMNMKPLEKEIRERRSKKKSFEKELSAENSIGKTKRSYEYYKDARKGTAFYTCQIKRNEDPCCDSQSEY